ncbi:hypothetical protein IMG5_192450 [Ichthyophthirius multifiliis]|uniref:sphingomyelin phosphodiesterase n=1 Tax=Ichthyophthirius multifiliis TaxID=5932 RepID=G0R4G6_ICHMU|nr:hypothetical protein IMG5_192450 [Ichthyophthirius multifiliis]EGR27641.1 hypothetical protein IMG5_192450 [Ichthyophthirius multifiliis]|eukprot:XP_004025093.1 hypothetical protein IMG5_192450 [Ichthyophthirius multifiliis]
MHDSILLNINIKKKQKSQNLDQIILKLLTYNLFLRPPLIKNNIDDFKNERTKFFLNNIFDFEIICLQEVFAFLNQRKEKIIENAIKQGFLYHAKSPQPSFFSFQLVDGGLLTLSKFPIVKKIFLPYKYGILSDNLSMKGVLYTKIQINDTHLHLFNTHLQASYVGNEQNVKQTVITRIDQLQQMKQFINKTLENNQQFQNELILICGDFNVNARNHTFPINYLDSYIELKNEIQKKTKIFFLNMIAQLLFYRISFKKKSQIVSKKNLELNLQLLMEMFLLINIKMKFRKKLHQQLKKIQKLNSAQIILLKLVIRYVFQRKTFKVYKFNNFQQKIITFHS